MPAMPTVRPPCSCASGVTVTSRSAPPRSMAKRDGDVPGWRSCIAATSPGERTGVAVDRHDAIAGHEARRARAGLPGNDSPIAARPGRRASPSAASCVAFPVGRRRAARATIVRVTGGSPARLAALDLDAPRSRALAPCSRRQRRSCQLLHRLAVDRDDEVARANARRRGRRVRPADPRAARAARECRPCTSPRRARPRAAGWRSGPAATMAMRFHTFCRLNARGRSAGATSPSRSSAIFT